MTQHFIGLMSGTSLDGVDGVLVRFDHPQDAGTVIHAHHLPMPSGLRQVLLELNTPGFDELHRAALATNTLMQCHAEVVHQLLRQTGLTPSDVCATGVHGQTVRHQPGPVGTAVNTHQAWNAYTLQLCNPALLAELCATAVVADFRSRDVAAGGQGAPLVPAFHRALFARLGQRVAVVNIGGMANATLLGPGDDTLGFDTGPGNVLMDLWCETHTGQPFDAGGAWAATAQADQGLLAEWLATEPYFCQQGARSTGRDLFNRAWLEQRLVTHPGLSAAEVQATLLALTVESISRALPAQLDVCVLCGGGALNTTLVQALQKRLSPVRVRLSDEYGLPVMQVEAAAFAWLARQTWLGLPGNVPEVTGARGKRVLGAVYPA